VSRRDAERLGDIENAIAAIRSHTSRGALDDGLVFDAVRARLIEIGEAVKALSPELTETEPKIPWSQIAGMRDRLTHHYFAASSSIIEATVTHDLPELEAAVTRMKSVVGYPDPGTG
jgi:uncharacterized protein with HEPN domain